MSCVLRKYLRKTKLWPTYIVFQKDFLSTSIVKKVLKLRGYQEDCIQSVLSYVNEGHKRLGVSLATGAGKTVIFTELIDRIKSVKEERHQTLILAHRQELVEQAARHCSQTYPKKTIEIEMGSFHATGLADITVASIQTLNSGSRLSKFDPYRFKLVLVDEAHHIVAPTYLRILNHFALSTLQEDSPTLIGFSATFSRTDGVKLGSIIDHITYHKDYAELIDESWLSKVIFTTVKTKADVSNVRRGVNGDFQSSDLSRAVNTNEINEITVRSWLERCSKRKSTLVFCVDLQHVIGITNKFRQYGIDAQFITGATPKSERSDRLCRFKQGEFPVLVNCGVFTEGTNIPNIDCVLLAKPTKSRNLLIQMIGRGMRLSPGKENCHIFDMVANLEKGIVTTPTLFGLDPQELVEEASPDDLKRLKKKKIEKARLMIEESQEEKEEVENKNIANTKITFTDYLSVHDLIGDTSTERFIRKFSPFAWVCVGIDRYILSYLSGQYLSLTSSDSLYTVKEHTVFNRFGRRQMFQCSREIMSAPDFETAVRAADTFAKSKYTLRFILTTATWRSRPATAGQLNFLNKFRSDDKQLFSEIINMGEASDMITKLKHGARGNFEKFEAERRRKIKKFDRNEREAAEKIKENVTVGPVLNL